MKITREYFIARVGHEPINDDLERCNCDKAGTFGHWGCGWNEEHDLPQFMVGLPEISSEPDEWHPPKDKS
jgi:hypothetical protein